MKIGDLYNFLNSKFPKTLSAPWDNDGLMCCMNKENEVKKIVIALDATLNSINYCKEVGANVLITHHPLIFSKIGELNDSRITSRRLIEAIRGDIAVFSFHTRLDSFEDGVNSCLAKCIGLTNVETFGDEESPTIGKIGNITTQSLESFAKLVKNSINATSIQYGGNKDVNKVALVGGSGKDYVRKAINLGADTFLTGEMSYNSMIDFIDEGINIVIGGHFDTEFPVCEYLSSLIYNEFKIKSEIFNNNLIKSI